MDCAAVMSTLEHPKEACLWYYNAVKLANLIASDENCLQLETLLSRFVNTVSFFLFSNELLQRRFGSSRVDHQQGQYQCSQD